MSRVWAIAGAESRRIFASPLVWAVLAVLQVILGFVFANLVESYTHSPMLGQHYKGVSDFMSSGLFGFANVLYLLVMPLMTMRLFAEERKNRSLPLLLSSPVSLIELVVGKYLGLMSFILAALFLLAIMPLSLLSGSDLDLGRIAAGLLGVLLMAMAFGAAGLFVSTLTREPTVAAVVSFGLLLLIWLLQMLGYRDVPYASVFGYLALIGHFDNLRRGLVASNDVIYYLLFIVVFLWLAVQRLDMERG